MENNYSDAVLERVDTVEIKITFSSVLYCPPYPWPAIGIMRPCRWRIFPLIEADFCYAEGGAYTSPQLRRPIIYFTVLPLRSLSASCALGSFFRFRCHPDQIFIIRFRFDSVKTKNSIVVSQTKCLLHCRC